MDFLVNLAQSFIGLFELGAETLVSWMTGIVPKVLLLLVFMNALIALIGAERVNKFENYVQKINYWPMESYHLFQRLC